MVSRIWCNRRPGAWSDQSDLHIGVSTESNQGTPILPAITIRAHNSNNVGIGTTNPEAKLHLKGTGDIQLKIDADSDNSGENDNPSILLTQDGELIKLKMGIIGNRRNYN